jgi:phage baseplate assembly protein W
MATPFTSLRHPFAIDSALGRVAQEADYDAHVRQLVMQVLMTAPGERINRPDFGCGIRRMVFAPNGTVSAALARTTVFRALQKWLPAVIEVGDVAVTAREEVLEVRVVYLVRARGERCVLNLEVTP